MKTMMRKSKEIMPKVSFGNKKLPKSTMIFNLPSVNTCPMKTSFCAQFCYAKKAERIYLQVLPARKYNLKLALSPDFSRLMIETITKHSKKIKTVRIHESGDFFNQEYVNKWFMIASEFPNITFYAYTKSFHLQFMNKPKNFKLIASFDESTTEQAKALYEVSRDEFDNSFTIVPKGEKASCIADCSKCSLCWTGQNLNLTVEKH